MPGVRLEGVEKRFGGVLAVAGVSLDAPDGQFVTLLGPSGCGKTTTLRMIAGLEAADAGRISIGERIVSDSAQGTFVPPERREIGMVFQSYAIWPHMTVFSNVAYPLEVRRAPRAGIRERVLSTLRLVEMEQFAERPATALSGGQQQRVAIARALVSEPAVLLMDEPLSNLDAKLREQMRVELRALQQRLGITTLYVTHDQEEAMVLSDLIAVMDSGRLQQIAAPEQIYFRPVNRTVAAFFGMPNLLDAKVQDVRPIDADTVLVRAEGDRWEGWASAPRGIGPGDSVSVLVRGEAMQVSRSTLAGHEGIAWTGTVRHTFFRGSRRMLTVQVGELILNVDAPIDVAAPPGAVVWLRVDAMRAWVVRK